MSWSNPYFDPPSPSPAPWSTSPITALPPLTNMMTSALSPSMVNIQAPFADAGHLKAAVPPASPQKKQRASSPKKASKLASSSPAPSSSPLKKARSSFKRTSSTASIMDAVMNSRAAIDHDTAPAQGLGLPISSSNIFEYSRSSPFASSSSTTLADLEDADTSKVLSTPRRGKRVGNVHMGWESPVSGERTPNAVPHTLPKIGRPSHPLASTAVEASPSKRKASTAFASELHTSQRSLVDLSGWASAAMISSVPLSEDRSKSSPGFSPRFVPEPVMTGLFSVETRDPFAAFTFEDSPIIDQNAKLVPLEVEGLGRVAIHRDFAQQITDHPPNPDSFASRRFSCSSDRDASALLRGCDSDDSAARSENGSSTDPTSAGTPCPSGISPSFSLSSQFPASEPVSPVKKMNKASQASGDISAETQKALMALMRMDPVGSSKQQDDKVHRPRLGGSSNSAAKLPTLDWPDCPSGPWSAAGRHIDDVKQKRREGIQRWLESDSSDETELDLAEPSGASAFRHHPMVAKALLDRARKLQRAQLSAAVTAAANARTPAKRGRKSKQQLLLRVAETPKRRGRKPKVAASVASSSRKSVATGASLARSNASAIFGCKCGIDDDSIIMVQCDGCRHWLHLPCVGIDAVNELSDEWFCDDCCEAALTEHLSPASSMPASASSYAHLSTPEALEAVLLGQEPVFTLPSGTPIHRHGVAVSSSIALAPSPPLLSVGDRGGRSTVKRQGQGRSRAERVGWRINEPGSPLARKSTTASSGVRPAVPETPSRSSEATADFTDASTTPSLLAGFSRADWEPTRASNRSERQATPPRMVGMSTPSRHASGRKASHSGPLSLGLGVDEAVHADVFSTPSRLASGGSWAYRSGAQPLGSQTPSRSAGRHQRVDSFSGGLLSTPGRDFLSGAFGTEPSTSMPSLVYSSGYVDGFEDHLGNEAFYNGSNSRAWQLQSPTSSTRAVRARQPSGLGTPWSSSLLKTPELQPRQPNMSSMRAGRFDASDDFPPSSSPFPRTPTFDMSSPRFLAPHSYGTHERQPSHLGLGLPSGAGASSSARLHKALGTAGRDGNRSNSSSGAKHRQVSTEVPMGLGIGLDLDDVLDWA
ncbi:Zinc finger, PHD-finger [Kalmanozyma brasiliensis GHG001]|uniref:Zinc finger PHD-type domain-containing protein n=1 Tax=Kalmanozyma brasiliensis (strain GHG001) TaxID=1365824 RepID=V5GI05_KALBG|nr:Zinc finger, PHD-finger [Kalmanozyma brasiliensis GHG001]EST05587.1 Zinc finger, PHD-finger [Kalmanozyma brasiliensis GHG001]